MPRLGISKRNKNIKEREKKNIQSGKIFQKSANNVPRCKRKIEVCC